MPDCPDNGPYLWQEIAGDLWRDIPQTGLSKGLIEWAQQPPLNLGEIADMVRKMPRIPDRKLKCHPSVTEALRACSPPPPEDHTWYAEISRHLMSMPVFEDTELPEGQWEVYEEDERIYWGNLNDV